MKVSIQRAAWLVLLFPLSVLGASSAQKDFAAVLKAKPDTTHGAQLFGQCSSCHGADGGGEANGSTPRIAGQHFRVIAKQLVDFRHGKRWDFRMEAQADRHHLAGAQDIADVAAYVSELQRAGKRGIGSGEFVAEGSQIYVKYCRSCHGASAEGNGQQGVPRLAGQHYAYLMRQMYDAVDGRRPALPRLHSQRIEPLDFEQVRAVSDFIARIGWNKEEGGAQAAPDAHPAP